MSDKNKTNNKYVTDDERERGKRIKELFDGLGITGEKFDEKYGLKIIDENGEEKDNPDGISYNTMKNHFVGKGLNIKNLVKYSKIFGVSTDYILFGGENSASIKEEPKDENKFELKKINEAIVLLMDIFGDDSVSYHDENINYPAHIEINIEVPQLVENARSIKNLRDEIKKSKNEDTKKWLSYGLNSTINAENMVVEKTKLGSFIYDSKKEKLSHIPEHIANPYDDVDEYVEEHYEIVSIEDDEELPF